MDDSYMQSDQWKLSIYLNPQTDESQPVYQIHADQVPEDFQVFLIDNQVYDWVFLPDKLADRFAVKTFCPARLHIKNKIWTGRLLLNADWPGIQQTFRDQQAKYPIIYGGSFVRPQCYGC